MNEKRLKALECDSKGNENYTKRRGTNSVTSKQVLRTREGKRGGERRESGGVKENGRYMKNQEHRTDKELDRNLQRENEDRKRKG